MVASRGAGAGQAHRVSLCDEGEMRSKDLLVHPVHLHVVQHLYILLSKVQLEV